MLAADRRPGFRIVDFHLRTRNHRGGGIGDHARDGPTIALRKNCPDDREIALRNFIGWCYGSKTE